MGSVYVSRKLRELITTHIYTYIYIYNITHEPRSTEVAMSPLEDWLLSEPRGEAGTGPRGIQE